MSVVRLNVPRLWAEPAIGSGCCVVPAGDVIKDELIALQGVQAVTVDKDAGMVTVTYDPANTDMQAICGAMLDMGYPAQDAV